MTTTDTLAAHKRILAPLFAAFPVEIRNVPAAEARAMVGVYAQALADLPPPLLEATVARLVATRERLPPPAVVRKVAVELQHGPKRPGGEAWGDVIKAMKRWGARRPPCGNPACDQASCTEAFHLSDPLVARAVASLSWTDLCLSENIVADRARFIELYNQLCDSERLTAQISSGATSRMLPRAGDQKPLAELIAGHYQIAPRLLPAADDSDPGDNGAEP